MSKFKNTILLLQIILFPSISLNALARTEQDMPISIHEVGTKVKAQNILVLSEMERVYQAKQAVRIARTNLLPKLNLWRMVKAGASYPTGLLEMIEDLVPFLMPKNWFELKQQSLFYQAELQAAQALKANQVFNAKNLYLDSLADLRLKNMILNALKNSKDVLEYIKLQEEFGQAPQGASELLKIQILAFQDDLKSIEQLLLLEVQTLSQLVGLPSTDKIKLQELTVAVPQQELDQVVLQERALEKSPELKQYDFLVSASQYIRRAAYFSFLGMSSMTRGVGNGVFDTIPVQDGLGFGMGATVAVGRSYVRQLELQKEGAKQTLDRQIQAMVMSYHLDLERYTNAQERQEVAGRLYKAQLERLSLGQSVPALELMESLQQGLRAQTDALVVETRLRQTLEKVSRITFEGEDYSVGF